MAHSPTGLTAEAPTFTDLEGPVDSFLTPAVLEKSPLFQDERFPNIVTTLSGTVLASWGSQNIRVRRSEDGGATWGEPITVDPNGFQGGGTLVDETTGAVFLFVQDGHPPSPLTVYKSDDDGRTWSATEVVLHPDASGAIPSMHMNESGITLRRGPHAGRLIRASRYYAKGNQSAHWPNHYTNAIYSDDHGATWSSSAPFPENGTGEAAIAELADGTLLYNSRSHFPQNPRSTRRRQAISDDQGASWKDWTLVEALPDGRQDRAYGCMGGLVRLPIRDEDILVYSNLDTDQATRERVTIWVSFDGGATWPVKRLAHEGPSAYSSLATGRPGTPSEGWIYLHYENGGDGGSTVARFNLTWALDGQRTGDGAVPPL